MSDLPNNFEFWAQKRGDSWMSTGWRVRYFKCDVLQRTITYYKGNEAKGMITVVKASERKQTDQVNPCSKPAQAIDPVPAPPSPVLLLFGQVPRNPFFQVPPVLATVPRNPDSPRQIHRFSLCRVS